MTSPQAPDDPRTPTYDELIRRAHLIATFRKIQRREASRRLHAATQAASSVAIDAAMLAHARRNHSS